MSTERVQARKVCIVGAGVSGLRAAELLISTGFEVTVLEARDRIGGRVNQTAQIGLPVDTGASWIHGTKNNPFVALAEKAKATTVACGAVESICDQNGKWLTPANARGLYEEVWEILEKAMKISKDQYHSLDDTTRMADFFRQEVERRYDQQEPSGGRKTLILHIVEMWGAFMGNEYENQSMKNLWLDCGLEGDNLLVASTFKDIVNSISPLLSDRATLRLNCEVTRIWNSQDDQIKVEASDGYEEMFSHVLVTAPLGWLKRNEDVFSPPLDPMLSGAIHNLGYGNLDKVFIRFPKAFWECQTLEPNHDSHTTQTEIRSHSFPIESLFLSPVYARDTNPAKWRQEIISYSGLPAPFSQPVIMFFVYGQWGRHVTGVVRGLRQGSEEYYRLLDQMFLPYYSKLPGYNVEMPECKPVEYVSTDWQNDKFAGYGSYTNQPVGSGDCAQHFETLRQGMGKKRHIWFAGEHTSPPGGLGTVTGAYWSGGEAARRIALQCGVTIEM